MADVGAFIKNQSDFEKELAKVMDWKYIEGQKKGSSYDCLTKDGEKIEIKMDWGSKKTGNHYLEFEQRTGINAPWIPSGFSLSKDTADYWVVLNNDFLYMLKIKDVERMIKEKGDGFKIRTTRKGINSNRFGQDSKAYLVPLNILEEYAIKKIKSPLKNPKEYK